jgi:hypothetical protein
LFELDNAALLAKKREKAKSWLVYRFFVPQLILCKM